MKINFKNVILIFILPLCVMACSEDDDTVNPTSTPPTNNNTPTDTTHLSRDEFVKCKINGVEFISKDDTRFNTAKIVFGHHQLVGSNDTTNRIFLTLWDFKGQTGELNASQSNGRSNPQLASIISLQYLVSNPLATYDCNYSLTTQGITSGRAAITRYDSTVIEGTFDFTAALTTDQSQKVTVTDGEFRLKY